MPILMMPPAIVQPAETVEVEDYGAVDVFATGWTMDFGAEIITGISHIDRIERGVIRRQVVVRVRYPRSQWLAAVDATLVGVRGGRQH